MTFRARRIGAVLALALMTVSLSPAFGGSAVEAGPYVWKPVTIKANGFIDGIVYSPAAKDVVFIHTDMGGAYRWDAKAGKAGEWVCVTDWANSADPAAKHMG